MNSVSEIRDAIQTFSAHAHSCNENIDSILDICMAILGQIDRKAFYGQRFTDIDFSDTAFQRDRKEALRDSFAMAAVAGMITGDFDASIVASEAYEIADAMLAARGDKPAFQPQKFTANYSRPHKFDFWKMSGLKHTNYPICKCGFSENNAIHQKENQDVNTINE